MSELGLDGKDVGLAPGRSLLEMLRDADASLAEISPSPQLPARIRAKLREKSNDTPFGASPLRLVEERIRVLAFAVAVGVVWVFARAIGSPMAIEGESPEARGPDGSAIREEAPAAEPEESAPVDARQGPKSRHHGVFHEAPGPRRSQEKKEKEGPRSIGPDSTDQDRRWQSRSGPEDAERIFVAPDGTVFRSTTRPSFADSFDGPGPLARRRLDSSADPSSPSNRSTAPSKDPDSRDPNTPPVKPPANAPPPGQNQAANQCVTHTIDKDSGDSGVQCLDIVALKSLPSTSLCENGTVLTDFDINPGKCADNTAENATYTCCPPPPPPPVETKDPSGGSGCLGDKIPVDGCEDTGSLTKLAEAFCEQTGTTLKDTADQSNIDSFGDTCIDGQSSPLWFTCCPFAEDSATLPDQYIPT